MESEEWKLVHHQIYRKGPEEYFPVIKEQIVRTLDDVWSFLQNTNDVSSSWYFGMDLVSFRSTPPEKMRVLIVNFPVIMAPQLFVDLMSRIFGDEKLSFSKEIYRVWFTRRSMNPQIQIDVGLDTDKELVLREIVAFCQAFQRSRMEEVSETRFSVEIVSTQSGLSVKEGSGLSVKNTLDSMKSCLARRDFK